MNIRTFDNGPFPPSFSSMRWSAIDEDTYDGAPDGNCTQGLGKTESEAIHDLTCQMMETNNEH